MSDSQLISTQESAITSVFKSGEPLNIAEGIAEVLIDNVLDDGFLKDIPLASTIKSVLKSAKNINDTLYKKKLLKMIFETQSIPADKRYEFAIELEDATGATAGEIIADLLDKYDNVNKATILGKLIKARTEEHITIEEFLRLTHQIKNALYWDLIQLPKYESITMDIDEKFNNYTASTLQDCGFISVSLVASGNMDSWPPMHRTVNMTDLGSKLVKYGF